MSPKRYGIGHRRTVGLSIVVLLLTLGPLSIQEIDRLASHRATAFEATPKTLAAPPVASRKSTSTAIRPRQPTAVVIVGAANVRSGPGKVYPRVTIVRRSDRLTILGQAYGCVWLKMATPKGPIGWISASLTDWVPSATIPPPPSDTLEPPPPPTDTLQPPPTLTDTPPPTPTDTPTP